MKLEVKHLDNMWTLIQFAESLPPQRINMGIWAEREHPNCGTIGCLAGHVADQQLFEGWRLRWSGQTRPAWADVWIGEEKMYIDNLKRLAEPQFGPLTEALKYAFYRSSDMREAIAALRGAFEVAFVIRNQ